MTWIMDAPLVLIAPLILLLLFGGMELGLRAGRWRRKDEDEAGTRAPDYLLSAMLGLLALLLGFTFALALNRYENRRELVVQEANAIGTTWLRSQILEEPARARMSVLLRNYADARLAWSRAPDMAATAALQARLWSQMGLVMRQEPSVQLARALMESMNDSFDLASARDAGRNAHVPGEVLVMLAVCGILSAMMLGHMMRAHGRRHRAGTTLLIVLVGLVMLMIFDLDRPASGLIQVSQQPMEKLRASMAQ